MFESPQRTTLEDQQQSRQFVCGARCTTVNGTEFEFHAIPRKLRDRATLKIDSGEKSFPLEVANQVARYFRCPQALSASVTKQPFLARMGLVRG